MYEFCDSQEMLWYRKCDRPAVDPHRVTRPAGVASPAPDHVHPPGCGLILRRKLAASRNMLSHAF